jgi:hypothetical protein
MTKSTEVTGLGAGRYLDVVARPANATTTVHQLKTHDKATVNGVLSTVPGAKSVVCLMHPRSDSSHHGLINPLLNMGTAVWSQQPRSVNNDLQLVHEQALLDVAAGMSFLRGQGFESVIPFGHSGGGTLYAFYIEQAGRAPSDRIGSTPAGRPTQLGDAEMPPVDGVMFMAPHPGQGKLLLGCIDPSVADEADPLSVVSELNPFDPANGFAEPPESSTYSAEFIERYRWAQHDRIRRIDDVAREWVANSASARAAFKKSNAASDRRAAIAPRIMTVYRTDADLRTVDLSIDPNERPYGSVYGRRPDLTNYGLTGFGRLTTPEAWLSTWSGLSSNADFVRCAPGVTVPTLFIELTGDQSAFPSETNRMVSSLGSTDLTHTHVRGTHFGGAINAGDKTGFELASSEIQAWLASRFALSPLVG